jgi:predicted MFS family arabinose efflux permease
MGLRLRRNGGLVRGAPGTLLPVPSAPDLAPQQRATYREVLADRRFRLLFVTRTLTVTADSLRIMTLSELVFATTGSPLLGALTFGVGFLPQLAGSLLLASLADRARPRRLVTAGYGLQCAAAAVMGVVHLPVAAILVVIAVVACLTPAFSGVTNRLIAETLTGDAYVLGRSLSNMSASAAQLLGLAGGGAAVELLGPRTALLLSAGAYLAAAVAVRLRLSRRYGTDRGRASARCCAIVGPATRSCSPNGGSARSCSPSGCRPRLSPVPRA